MEQLAGLHYLAFQLKWWLLGALGFGFAIGWLACSRRPGNDPS